MKSVSSKSNNSMMTASLRYVLLLAVAARVLLPFLATITTGGNALFHARDTNSYIQPAIALISEGRFARWGEPEIIRTPGYPILLIPGIALGHVELVTITFQIALSVLTVFLVYRITLLLFNRAEIATLSALLYAIEPLSILTTSKLLTETLFTALAALFLYFLLRYWEKGLLTHLVLSAIALAAAAYVRPIAYYLPILVFIILLVWVIATRRKNSRRLAHICVFLLTSMGLIGIWQIRNKIESGYPGFSAAAEHSLYYWDAASVIAVLEGLPVDEVRDQMGYSDEEVYFRNFPDQRGWKRGEIVRSMGKSGMEIILSNPGTYSVLVFKGTLRTLLDPAATEYLRMFRLYPEAGGLVGLINDQGVVAAVEFLFEEMPLVFWANLILEPVLILYLFLAIFGVAHSRIRLSMPMILFLGLTVYFLVLTAAGIGTSKGRHPIMPMICVLAGYSLFWIVSHVRAKWSLVPARFLPSISDLAQ